MKVIQITASATGVRIELESEHPAEAALCNLLEDCRATTHTLTTEVAAVGGANPANKSTGLLIEADINKKNEADINKKKGY